MFSNVENNLYFSVNKYDEKQKYFYEQKGCQTIHIFFFFIKSILVNKQVRQYQSMSVVKVTCTVNDIIVGIIPRFNRNMQSVCSHAESTFVFHIRHPGMSVHFMSVAVFHFSE